MRVFGDFSRLNAARCPQKTALVMGEERLDYHQLHRRSNALANGLRAMGVGLGDRVAILALNCPDYAVVAQAVAKIGAVLVPVNARYSVSEIGGLLSHCEPKVLFLEPEFAADVTEASRTSGNRPGLIVMGAAAPGSELPTLAGIVAEQSPILPRIDVDPSSAAVIMYTGGTTGAPKGVVYSHHMYLRLFWGQIIEGSLEPSDVLHVAMPLFHNGGFAGMLNPSMMIGATSIIYRGSFEPERVLADIEQYKITLVQWIPTMLTLVLPHIPGSARNLSSLNKIWYGSMPIMPATLDEVRRLLPSAGLYQVYGTTDCGLIGFLRPEDHVERSQTTGRPAFNTESRIVDDDGRDVPVGGVGEIIVNRETSGMIGYWRNEAETAKTIRDGWLHTGDLARREAGGYFTIVDRKSFMIISGGENIYPKEVEEVLSRHPAVYEVAVFGIPDDKYGETVCAAVSLKPGSHATAEELVSFCDGRIARYKRPKHIEFLKELPKTAVGKLAKTVLREPFWADRRRRV